MMLNSFYFLYSIVDQTLVMSLLVFIFVFVFFNETIYCPRWHISSHLGRITQFSCYKHDVSNLHLFNEYFYDY